MGGPTAARRRENPYRVVPVRLYSEPAFDRLPRWQPCARALYLFLRTGPYSRSFAPLLRVGRAALAEHLDWTSDEFASAFAALQAEQLAHADWSARLIYLPGVLADDPPANPNVVTGWGTYLRQLPARPLRQEALAEAELLLDALDRRRAEQAGQAGAEPIFGPAFTALFQTLRP